MKKLIHIKDYFPAYISSRKSINILKSQIDFNIIGRDIEFDFSDIVFISRSFAHEFIQYTKFEKLNAEFSNMNTNVSTMFSAVKKSEVSSRSSFNEIPVTSLKNKTELDGFFATI